MKTHLPRSLPSLLLCSLLVIVSLTAAAQTTVIYVQSSSGNDNNAGTTAATPVKTLLKAYQLLPSTGTWDDNYIVLMNNVSTGNTLYTQNWSVNSTPPTDYAKNVTITGSYGGTTYSNAVFNISMSGETHRFMWGNTRLDHLVVNGSDAGSNGALRIYLQGNDFYVGEGVSFTGCRGLPINSTTGCIASNAMGGISFQDISIIAGYLNYNGNYTDASALPYAAGHVCHLTLLSGKWGRVVGGGRNDGQSNNSSVNPTSKNIFGHADRPWGVEITVGGTANVNLLAGGQCDGTIYANSTINLQAGTVGRLLGGSLAYSRSVGNNPANSYYGTSTINMSGGTVYEFYGGSLGRYKKERDSTFYYGTVLINIIGGNVKGNVYAAGAGGVMGYHADNGDAHKANAANYVTTTTVNISGNAVIDNDVYGGGYGYSQYLESNSQMLPNGGSFYGESHVNVAGGHVKGSVFGGGKGYRSTAITSLAIAQTEGRIFVTQTGGTVDGSLYGGGLGITGYPTIARHRGFTSVVFSGGTLGGNIYGGGNVADVLCDQETEYRTVSSPIATVTVSPCNTSAAVADGSHVHDVYGGGSQSSVTGDSYARMTGGAVTGNLYGGGMEGAVVGASHVEMSGGTVTGCLYGGGYEGDVTGSSHATMTGGTVTLHLFGGGHQATVSGDTFVDVHGNAIIDRNVYGGGNAGEVGGSTHVKVGANP